MDTKFAITMLYKVKMYASLGGVESALVSIVITPSPLPLHTGDAPSITDQKKHAVIQVLA